MHVDMSSGFGSVFNFIFSGFRDVLSWMDGIIIYNGFSVLDFSIAILVFGLVFTVVLSTVQNFAGGAQDVGMSVREQKRARMRDARKNRFKNG